MSPIASLRLAAVDTVKAAGFTPVVAVGDEMVD